MDVYIIVLKIGLDWSIDHGSGSIWWIEPEDRWIEIRLGELMVQLILYEPNGSTIDFFFLFLQHQNDVVLEAIKSPSKLSLNLNYINCHLSALDALRHPHQDSSHWWPESFAKLSSTCHYNIASSPSCCCKPPCRCKPLVPTHLPL